MRPGIWSTAVYATKQHNEQFMFTTEHSEILKGKAKQLASLAMISTQKLSIDPSAHSTLQPWGRGTRLKHNFSKN